MKKQKAERRKRKATKARVEGRESREQETPRVVARTDVGPGMFGRGPQMVAAAASIGHPDAVAVMRLGAGKNSQLSMADLQKEREAASKLPELAVLKQIPLGELRPSPTNPRKDFPAEALKELAENIRVHGILQPLVVRSVTNAESAKTLTPYEIVCGERRYRAAKLAQLATVPCLVRMLTDAQVLELQVIENLQRADLTPLEEAEGYRKLLTSGLKVADLEGRLQKSRSHIFGMLRLTRLTPPVRAALVAGKISASVAGLIAQVAGVENQNRLLDEAVGWDGEPRSFRHMKEEVTEYQTDLRKAPFREVENKLAAPGLPGIKAAAKTLADAAICKEWPNFWKCERCSACPRRSGNLPAELGEGLSPDVCTDTECYARKVKAWGADYAAQGAKEGRQVFVGEEASHRWHSGNFVEPNDTDWDSGKKVATLVKEAAKAGKEIKPVTLVRDNGETKTVYARASLRAAQPPETKAKRAEASGLSEFEQAADRARLALAQKLAEGPQGVEFWETLLEIAVEQWGGYGAVKEWWLEHGKTILGCGKTKDSLSWTEAQKLRTAKEWLRLYVRDELNVAGAQGLAREPVAQRRQFIEWLLPVVSEYEARYETNGWLERLRDWFQRWGVECKLTLGKK